MNASLEKIRENDERGICFRKIDFTEFVIRENGFRESDVKPSVQDGAGVGQCGDLRPKVCVRERISLTPHQQKAVELK